LLPSPPPTPTRNTFCRAAWLVLAAYLSLSACNRQPAPAPADAGDKPPAVVVTPPAPARHEPYPFHRAVLLTIGIDSYPKLRGLSQLHFAEADARGVAEVFERLYGFEVVPLYGPAASKKEINATLERLGEELGDGDVLVVFFAGHGLVIPAADDNRAGYLIPADADLDATDFHEPERWSDQALDMRRLTSDIERMKAQHVLFIADACCSGFMTTRGALARADLKTFLFQKSRAVFAATTQSQSARENAAAQHGHFTAALLDELRRDDAMSVVDLFAPIVRRVAKETNGGMTPTLGHFGSGEGTFVFIPKSIPRSEIEADLGGRVPATEPPKGLAGVAARQRERLALVTTEAELYQAMVTRPYAFAPRAEEIRQAWEKRFARFRENAGAGDPWAMAALHVCYARGLGTGKNPELAYFWARQLDAVEKPAGAGQFFLAECYRHGLAVAKQTSAAEKLYRDAAARGFLPGEFFVAETTLRKKSPTADEIAGVKKVLERGRERKYPPAIGLLAWLNDGGFAGVKPDPKMSVALFEEAAGLGDTQGMIFAYKALGAGRPGVARDVARAERYLRQAADQGDADAQFRLAIEYAADNSGRVLNFKSDDGELFRWALLAAEQGHPGAQVTVALACANGYGTERNADLAKQWCEKAAAQNYPDAFFLQGEWYQSGVVLGPPNKDKAAAQYRRAADLGHPKASLAYVTLWRLPTGGFVFRTGNWMEILRQATRAAMTGNMPPKEADDLVWNAYKHLIQGQGNTDAVRWEQFRKTYPEEAREMAKRLDLPAN
jgi:TPR repeat protein